MRKLRMLPVYLALVGVALLFLFPFYWVVISSLKSVEGMTLKPPALYPAEAQTVDIPVTNPTLYEMEGQTWFRLSFMDWQEQVMGPFGWYIQVDGDKPTQLVKNFLKTKVKPSSKKLDKLIFTKVTIHSFGKEEAEEHEAHGADESHEPGKELFAAIVAKSVRQKDGSFQELLFVKRPPYDTVKDLTGLDTVPHTEVLTWSAHPENFSKALEGPEATIGGKSSGFLLFMRNSFFISCMAVIGQILASSLVAFGFSRLWFKGRDFLFVLLLATLMVPAQVTLIPLFTIYKSLGWIDTFLPLIVPHFTAGAFNVFLIRQFMLTLPKELDESAAMDGATPFRVYRSIIFPMCAPVLIVVGLFTFVATWQDVMGPLIYLDNPDYRTVSLGLEFFRSPYVDNRPLLMA
ncbi:MAG TPA: carbohydrate ABC transporter permease, partial [Fimbriimonas sp.]|nr:carbohydrate ABC transporter permease [Fimbriimonas sp.]